MTFFAAGAANSLDRFTDQTLIMGLSTTLPTSSISEPSGGSYASATVLASDWASANAGNSPPDITTTAAVSFPAPTASWGSPGWIVFWESTKTTPYRWAPLAGGAQAIGTSNPTVTVTPTLEQPL